MNPSSPNFLDNQMKIIYLKKNTAGLVKQIYSMIEEGIALIQYFDYIHGEVYSYKNLTGKVLWGACTLQAYYQLIVEHWSRIFGSDTEPTHYFKLLKKSEISSALEKIGICPANKENLKGYLYKKLNISSETFDKLHKKTLRFRSKILVHKEFIDNSCLENEKYFSLHDLEPSFFGLFEIMNNLALHLPTEKTNEGDVEVEFYCLNDLDSLKNYLKAHLPTSIKFAD